MDEFVIVSCDVIAMVVLIIKATDSIEPIQYA